MNDKLIRERGNIMRLPHILTGFFLVILLVPTLVRGQDSAGSPSNHTFSLREVLDLALDHNPLIPAGKATVEQHLGSQQIAQAYPNPSVNVQSGRGTILDPSNGEKLTERYVTMSQPLEWPGKRAARQKAADAGVQSAQAALQETRLHLTASVKQSFYQLLLAQQHKALLAKTLTTVERLGKAVGSRVKAGEAAPFENIKVQVEILKVRKNMTHALGELQSARAQLYALTGGKLDQHFSIQGEFSTVPKSLNVEELSQFALDSHPRLRKLQKAVEKAKHQYTQQKEARIPDLVISGSYQRDAGRESFLGGLTIPLPLWYQQQGEIAQARGTQHYTEAELLKAQQDIVSRIIQQFQRSQAASAQIVTYEQGLLKEAREALRMAQVSFRYGETNLIEMLDTQRTWSQTLLGYAQAKYDLSLALLALEQLTGKELT
jgi:cobalt-zinc-cadmium efflux system outer membrane protein